MKKKSGENSRLKREQFFMLSPGVISSFISLAVFSGAIKNWVNTLRKLPWESHRLFAKPSRWEEKKIADLRKFCLNEEIFKNYFSLLVGSLCSAMYDKRYKQKEEAFASRPRRNESEIWIILNCILASESEWNWLVQHHHRSAPHCWKSSHINRFFMSLNGDSSVSSSRIWGSITSDFDIELDEMDTHTQSILD